jgi:hypothetical protein
MKDEVHKTVKNALLVPFHQLMPRPHLSMLAVPRQERAAVATLAPAFHSEELKQRQKEEALERERIERELQRRRNMQQAVHSVD